jgi:hypothetical protein
MFYETKNVFFLGTTRIKQFLLLFYRVTDPVLANLYTSIIYIYTHVELFFVLFWSLHTLFIFQTPLNLIFCPSCFIFSTGANNTSRQIIIVSLLPVIPVTAACGYTWANLDVSCV